MNTNYPVIVGVGQLTNHPATVDDAIEPLEMMATVARAAERDAGVAGLLPKVDSIQVPNVMSWQYPDLPGALAERISADPPQTLHTTIGGETPQRLVNETAQAIVEGRTRIALIAGAETLASRRVARKTRQHLPWTERGTPGQLVGDSRTAFTEIEARHGATLPNRMYPLFENAIRAHLGHSIDDHQAHLGRLYSRLSAVAADNPDAWFQTALSPDDITNITPDNRWVSFPYPKLMNAMIEIDQSAAVILTGTETARELGVPEDRWVYLRGCGDAYDTWFVSDRANYYESPAIRAATQRALGMAGISVDDIAAFDLYSCFPSAVQMAMGALGLSADDPRPLSVTGGLPYAGGPGNNYVTHSISRMVERLRERGQEFGMVTGLGWFFTKHSAGVYSTEPPDGDWQRTDPAVDQAQVDALESPPFVEQAEGDAVVETYTVAFDHDGNPSQGIIIGRLSGDSGARPDGRPSGRFFANTPSDADLLWQMTREEFVGRPGRVTHDASTQRNVFTPA
ncbi:MAG: acetyl-CoA acetyltransferase [Chloroflexi bacterium]|nr:acetyl-CoA acetyltransferase [Chloroflexota bacterium]